MKPSAKSQTNQQGSGSSNQQDSRIPAFVIASLWMGLGGYALTSFIPVAMAMIAYGFSFLFSHRSLARASQAKSVRQVPNALSKEGEKPSRDTGAPKKHTESASDVSKKNVGEIVLPLFFMALGVFLGALFPPASLVTIGSGIVAGLLSLFVAILVIKRKATITTWFVLSAFITFLMIVAEALAAQFHGQTLIEALAATTSDTVQSLEGTLPLSIQAEMTSLIPFVQMLWPFALFCAAGISVACAHASARIAQLNVAATQRRQITMWRLSAFDTPVWAPVALALGIVCFAFSPAFMAVSSGIAFWIQSAGLSTIMAVRIIFLLDGAATLSWLLEKKKWGCFVRILIWIVVIYLEGFCFLLSIIGFIDFWANFRKRNRTRKHTIR